MLSLINNVLCLPKGRFISLSGLRTMAGTPASQFPVIIVDRAGLIFISGSRLLASTYTVVAHKVMEEPQIGV